MNDPKNARNKNSGKKDNMLKRPPKTPEGKEHQSGFNKKIYKRGTDK